MRHLEVRKRCVRRNHLLESPRGNTHQYHTLTREYSLLKLTSNAPNRCDQETDLQLPARSFGQTMSHTPSLRVARVRLTDVRRFGFDEIASLFLSFSQDIRLHQ